MARRLSADRLSRTVWSTTDRLLATLAHAAIAFGFFGIGFLLSLAINVVIWLVSRRSGHVAVHAEQAGAYQLLVFVINVVVVVLWLLASVALFGQILLGPPGQPSATEQAVSPWLIAAWLLAVPVFAVWYVGTIVLGLYGALRVATGQGFWYPVVGAWARRKHSSPQG